MNILNNYHLTCTNPDDTHIMAYNVRGNANNPNVLICVHGLTRNKHDFDFIADALSDHYRVVCVDVVGRCDSSWLSNPEYYGYPQYVDDLQNLIKHLGVNQVDWLGTSMGGLIGMFIAVQPQSPIRRLILNDIGAFLPKAALERINTYLQKKPHFDSLGALEIYLREVHAPFGKLTDEQWQHLALHSSRADTEGGHGYFLAYDYNIVVPFINASLDDIDLYDIWEKVTCPVLSIRGEASDILLPETVTKMASIHADFTTITIKDTGHAPALMDTTQIQIVRDWLLKEKLSTPA